MVARRERSRRRQNAAERSYRSLKRVHIVVAQAEMMADLVDQDMMDELFEAIRATRPFIEDRAAV
jgi:hypothetical protein